MLEVNGVVHIKDMNIGLLNVRPIPSTTTYKYKNICNITNIYHTHFLFHFVAD